MAEARMGGERIGEDKLVAVIRKVLSGGGPGVVVGPGDDAAVVDPPRGASVLTTDLLVEGVHFDRALTSARDLGHKAVVVNVSDVAAMGGSPRYALVSLGLSEHDDPSWVVEMYGGMRAACDEYALSLVGGDLNRSSVSVISVSVVGEVAQGRAILRSGPRPGDRSVVAVPAGAVDGAREQLGAWFGVALADVGGITEYGFVGVDESGGERPLEPRGWDHLAG